MPFLIPIVGMALAGVITYTTMWELIALTIVSQLLTPKASMPSQLNPGIAQEYSGTTEPRRIVYGLNMISGLNCIPPWNHGSNNEMMDQVLAVAGHEVASITDIYANQTLIASANITAITGSANDGKVTSGAYANKLWVRRYLGTQSQTVDWILNNAWPSYWDANHKGLGVAYLAIQFQYDTTVYASGKPDIRALVTGKKVYDPRLDSTNGGAGTQRYTDPTTWTYSNNPALCICDYIIDTALGVGEAPTRIDWTMAIAAANACDELVSIPGSTTQKRYTCNQILTATDDYEPNLRALASAMQGDVLYSSGKWVLFAGKYQTPSFTITDDQIVGAISYRTAFPYKDRYNAVRGQFYDPLQLYVPNEYPPIRVTADETADGEGPIWKELQLPHCNDQYEAQRNAIILQRKSRRKKTWSLPAGYSLYGIRPGEFGTLSIAEMSLVAQPVKCTGWKLDGKNMQMSLVLEEVNSADWNDPATVTYQTTTALSGPAAAAFTSAPTTGFSATGGAGGITFAWSLPVIWYNNLTVELLEAAANNIAGATVVWSGVNTGAFLQKGDTTTRYYWTRIRNTAGNTVSTTTPAGATAGLAAAASSIVGPQGIPGTTGPGGLVAMAATPNFVFVADQYHHVTTYPMTTKFYVFLGNVDVTGSSTFALAPGGNPASLGYSLSTNTLNINSGFPDGVDTTTLTIRCTYSGNNIDVIVYLSKAMAGATGGTGPQGTWGPTMWTPVVGTGMTQTGAANFQKSGASSAWDAQVYSVESYPACYVSFSPGQSNKDIAVGLSVVPTTDAGYANIDWIWNPSGGATCPIYHLGTQVFSGEAYSGGDIFTITYDGYLVRFYRNGIIKYAAADAGKKFFLDSSFYQGTGSPPVAGVQNLSFGPLAEGPLSNGGVGNFMSTATWKVGTTGSQGNYIDVNGGGTASAIVLGDGVAYPKGPYGFSEPLWRTMNGAGASANGGFDNEVDIKGLDPNKTYRSIIWFRYTGAVAGQIYHGCSGTGTLDVAGTTNSNPYFYSASEGTNGMIADKWYMSVGFIHGSGFGTTPQNIGAVYDPVTGKKMVVNYEFKQVAGITTQGFRAYHYYASNAAAHVFFCRPRFEEVNGNEPSIPALLSPSGILAYLDTADTAQISANAATAVYFSNTAGLGNASCPAGSWFDEDIIFLGAGAGPAVDCSVLFSAVDSYIKASSGSDGQLLMGLYYCDDGTNTSKVRGTARFAVSATSFQNVTLQDTFAHLAANAAASPKIGIGIYNTTAGAISFVSTLASLANTLACKVEYIKR